LRAADRAGREADRGRHRADDRVQRLGSRADAARAPGVGARRGRRQRGRPRGDRPLARPAAGEPLRPHARDAGRDPRAYWYHPHIREDYGQELGQYGNILGDPTEPDYWPPAHRELLLTLDDVFVEDGAIAPFSRD